jgi:predicted ATPase
MEEKVHNRSKLTKLKISGFKSLAGQNDSQEMEFDDVTVIIGQNGAGKSNLVSFFSMLNMMSTSALQEYIATRGFANSLLYYGSKYTKTISAELIFRNENFEDSYRFTLSHASPDTLIFTEEKIIWGRVYQYGKNEKNYGVGHSESRLFTAQEKEKAESIIYTILSSCRVYQFHDTSTDSHIKQARNIQDN